MSTRVKRSIRSFVHVLTSTIELISNVLLIHYFRSSALNRHGYAMAHSKSCLGMDNCIKLVKFLRAHVSNSKKNGMFRSIQEKLIDSIFIENPKDKNLFRMIKLICEHNMSIIKIRDKRHVELLRDIEPVSHETVFSEILELSITIEEKISSEMKGRKGSILHDGWSRCGTHFFYLMACCVID